MLLELRDISLEVDKQPYLHEINLQFKAGEFSVLLGRTLAGKTSLMRVIAGLEKPTQGSVWLNGKDITTLPVQDRQVSMVYQQFINYPHLTVEENIASPLRLTKIAPAQISKRVKQIAELLHIGPFLKRLPLELSGGQQQRCAMARALVKDAQIILFDEPLVNLDYKLRESLRHELKALFKARESIAIYASTEAHEALALGGNTCLLHQGRVLQSGPALSQFYQPVNLDAADLYHEPPMNQFSAQVADHGLLFDDGTQVDTNKAFTDLASGNYVFGVRPDKIKIDATNKPEIRLIANVDLAEISASETYLHVTIKDSKLASAAWVIHLQGIHNFHYDSEITLYLPISELFVFDAAQTAVSWPSANHFVQREAG